ncbi:MAG: tetratricopeptide repeat protein [Cephaloticoccus sp.]|nr:tetratricopeptide repeat protein [Cephaloticoccus sp.]MCF7760261.1 tetratricopeptide repeat protein [Cephaloticoccus sp.]
MCCPRRFIVLSCCLLAAAIAHADAGVPVSLDAYSQALSLYKAKNYPDARTAFQILAVDEPTNAKVRYFLGVIALKRNDFDDAIVQLEKATTLDPANSSYFAELGGAYGSAANQASLLSQLGLAKKCRFALEKAVELDSANLDARQGLVDYYRQAPSFLGGGVLKAYAQATEIRQRDLERGTLILGQLYVADRRFAEAIALFEELLQAQPDNYLGHYSIGRIAAESGQNLDAGGRHLQSCLQLKPGQGEPSHAAAYWRLGNIAERRYDSAAARLAYEKALQLDPKFSQALESLTKLK